ncbi:hypothetical protein C8R46DRAFT_1004765 [Mycena filopes]|nr:hypothetical protein C8R46DRAFT_1004765 [Mycena filopes]
MNILGAAAYASSGSKPDVGFRGLWRRVRPDHEPEGGTHFNFDDTMFNPPPLTAGRRAPSADKTVGSLTSTAYDSDATPIVPDPPGRPPTANKISFAGPSSPSQALSEVLKMNEYLKDADLDGLINGRDWDLTPDGLRSLVTLQENVLSESQQNLGADHVETLLVASNLGVTYFRLGMFHQAGELQCRVVDKRKVVSGTDHQDTLTAMFHLAATYRSTKRLQEALTLGTEVVLGRKILFGAFNLPTLAAVHGVALTCYHLRRYSQAKETELIVFKGRKKSLGLTHQDTVRSMKALAVYRTLDDAGRSKGGENALTEMFYRTLAALEKGAE